MLKTRIYFVSYVIERVDGIEPTASAWKAEVLPLYDTRVG